MLIKPAKDYAKGGYKKCIKKVHKKLQKNCPKIWTDNKFVISLQTDSATANGSVAFYLLIEDVLTVLISAHTALQAVNQCRTHISSLFSRRKWAVLFLTENTAAHPPRSRKKQKKTYRQIWKLTL